MVMRASSYIFFADYPNGRETILFHGIFGIVDKVEKNVADLLRSGEISEEAIEKYQVSLETLSFLASRGYLTDLSLEEEHKVFVDYTSSLHQRALRYTQPSFSLVPSYECNLRCFYCFQSHKLHEDQRLISRATIDLAFAAIAKFIKRNYDDPTPSAKTLIKLWGGEPLLEKNRPTIEYIAQKCRKNNYALKAITNGTELHAYLDLLGPEGISHVQVTLDGPREVHNKRRTDASLRPTFDIIAQNIAEALKRGIELDLRINVDEMNVESLPMLNEYISNQGWHKFPNFTAHVARITPSEQYNDSILIDSHRVLRTLNERKDECFLLCFPYSSIEMAVQTYFRTGTIPLRTTAYCSANLGYYILDLFGDIYACENEAGRRDKRIGTFHTGEFVLNGRLENDWLKRSVAYIPQCSRCPAALLCGGGCAYNAKFSSGTYFSSYCDGFKIRLAKILPWAYEKYKPRD